MKIEIIAHLTMISMSVGIVCFVAGLIGGLLGSSTFLLLSFTCGIISMIIFECLSRYLEKWYEDNDKTN